jgi:mannose-6-phosphate isomerase-like protein (cupin superfamily)
MTTRQWGHYDILYEADGCKVKELVIQPGKKISMQKHFLRSEHWFVVSGTALLYTYDEENKRISLKNIYSKWNHLHIPVQEWHQIENAAEEELHIIEIQYGENCTEEDIFRNV